MERTRKAAKFSDRVTSRFATAKASREAQSFASDLGGFVSLSAFMSRVADVYETAIPAARVTIVYPGRLMELRFHVDSLFEHDTETLRPAQRRAIAQLVSSLSSPPPGLRYETEAVFGIGAVERLLVSEDRAMRRAGVIARAFVEEGAPRQAVVVAIEESDPTQARFVFRVVTEEDRSFEARSDDAVPRGAR